MKDNVTFVKPYERNDGVAVVGHKRKVKPSTVESKENHRSGIKEGVHGLVGKGSKDAFGRQVPLVGFSGEPQPFVVENQTFENLDLSGLDLRGCEFRETNFRNVDFSGSDLRGAKFYKSTLTSVNFQGVNLQNVTMDTTHCEDVSADVLDLSGCDFVRVVLQFDKEKAILANLDKAALSKVELAHVDFSGQDLSNFDMSAQRVEKWGQINFSGANLENANLIGSRFGDCSFVDANMVNVEAYDATFNFISAAGVNLSKSNLTNVTIYQSDFGGAIIHDSILDFFSAQRTNFLETDFSGSKFSQKNHSRFSDCKFIGSNFTDVDFGFSQFIPPFGKSYNNLTSCKWRGAKTSDMMVVGLGESEYIGLVEKKALVADFEQYDFEEIVKNRGISDKQFEFLVLSGAVEVRDSKTHEIVRKDFNADKHYVPVWSAQNILLD